MSMKAEAFAGYNEAAIIDKFLTNLPELARAISEPLNKVDRITVLSTGNGTGAGTDKVTEDIGKMMVQIPALFDTLTGINFQDFIKRLPQVGSAGAVDQTKTKRDGNGSTPPPAISPVEDVPPPVS
jgi:flotillin